MTTTHLVVGAGPVGTAIARELVAQGHEVRLASRSGRGTEIPGTTRVAVDAADGAALTRLAEGAAVLYNALNPVQYHKWPTLWPPMAAALLSAAERSGAVLATVSNLYSYGRPDGPMSATSPLHPADVKGEVRRQMWLDTLAAHKAGRARIVEVRASDYVGAGADSHVTRAADALVSGSRARMIGNVDLPHSWTYTGDVARTLVAAAADDAAHGQAWIVPSNPPRTQREVMADMVRISGLPAVPISPTPTGMLRLLGVFQPVMRAVADSSYQFTTPFVVDDAATRSRFGIEPSSWDDMLRETLDHARTTAAVSSR